MADTVKTEESAEKFAEVANALDVRGNFDVRLAEARREGGDLVANARAELQTNVQAHTAKYTDHRQTTSRLSFKEEVLLDLRLEYSSVRSTNSTLIATRDTIRHEISQLTGLWWQLGLSPRRSQNCKLSVRRRRRLERLETSRLLPEKT